MVSMVEWVTGAPREHIPGIAGVREMARGGWQRRWPELGLGVRERGQVLRE